MEYYKRGKETQDRLDAVEQVADRGLGKSIELHNQVLWLKAENERLSVLVNILYTHFGLTWELTEEPPVMPKYHVVVKAKAVNSD